VIPPNVLRWKSLCQKYANIHEVLLWEEIAAVIWSESSGNPKACNPADPSYGLMQVTMSIGVKFSHRVHTPVDLYDPDINLEAGTGFLAYLKTRYAETNPLTDPKTAWIAAYNEGEPNLWKKIPDPPYIAAFVSHLSELQGGNV
jgi:soluble lytic murein transglycosylase-like protein